MRTLVLSLLAATAVTPAFAQRHGGYRGSGGFGRGGGFHGGYRHGVGSFGGYGGHLPTHRVYRPARGFGGYGGGLAVRPYRASEWRRDHPGWHDRYYYRGGRYFYDSGFAYPAVVDNEWGSIAALSGGVALLGAFDNDPYLTFGGAAGALYALSRYDHDRYHGDRYDRLRAAYFSRPYFYRGGVRYDRSLVTVGGARYYRFHRH